MLRSPTLPATWRGLLEMFGPAFRRSLDLAKCTRPKRISGVRHCERCVFRVPRSANELCCRAVEFVTPQALGCR